MPKFTNLHVALLSAGAARDGGSLLPLPPAITATRARIEQAANTLIRRKLAVEAATKDRAAAYRTDDRKLFAAVITDAGRAAVTSLELPTLYAASDAVSGDPAPAAAPAAATAPAAPREGSKQRQVVDLLQQDGGVALTALCMATGWLPHTTRAALTGLRKRGFTIVSSRGDGDTSYRIAG